ncbi:MAG: DHH family phosphoesterase [Peptostreptococcaceae bacterium]|nr:DHH family phosphoesterase [Peptostreptococcaceae bacterium]
MDENCNIKNLLINIPLPCCVIDEEGNVKDANQKMNIVFAYDGIIGANLFALTGVKPSELINSSKEEKEKTIERNGKTFSMLSKIDENSLLFVYFLDVTKREKYKASYKNKKLAMLLIHIDNYDELIASTKGENKMMVPTQVDKVIRNWASNYKASVSRVTEDEYIMFIYRENADNIIESKFEILDEVRKIESMVDFPVSLSIGMGISGDSPAQTEEYAQAAVDLALGRGGDQAVVKNGNRMHYYGGKLQTVEKSNKGKSRIIGHVLKQLIKESSKVLIMGHKWPDLDCFGASIGATMMCESCEKDAYIVIEEFNEALQRIYNQAKEIGKYAIISRARAIELCDEDTLVIIVDTHRPNLVECEELLKCTNKIAIIDHHRMAEDAIEDTTLAYIESYASSASELVTEMIQYSIDKKNVSKFEAEALLAGITVDTNSFATKTGVRTFEAAAWLRRAGADTAEVKRFFQIEATTFQARAEAIANAEYLEQGIALAISEGYSTEAQIINSQVADQLLTVKGIKASFVMGKNDRNVTVISARSLGEINVQIIMEEFNGGGHLTAAGAQVDLTPLEVSEKLKEMLPKYLDKTYNKE